MGLTNFIITVAGVSAVILLLRSDVKQSATIFRRNVKHIRQWLEEESAAASKLDESSSILKWTIASSTCTENLPGLQKMQHPRNWNQRFIKRMPPRRTSTSVYIEGLHLKRRLKSFTYTWWTAVKISLD
ncbi:uncharacterized protein LOC110600973 isoform X1 [Manihot esculenta]|uniref:uncharacterized protein LOC110600973 isoform X1 n=1 Tax=Manihot esculenta TaxID=3983 RepID=UPI000B5D1D06|nr:uncharacterized protein LOC110600973 isoform X1 [Manihot esculenta]